MTTSLDHKPVTGPESSAFEDEREGRTRLYVLLAVLGVVVVGAAAWLLLSGGDAETELVVTPGTARPTVASSTPTAGTPTPSATDVPAAAPVDAAGVDPFDPLVVPPPTSAATAPTGGVPTAPTTGPTSGPTAAPTSQPTSGPTTAPSSAPKKTAKPKATRTPVTLRMVAVAADNSRATILVNGKKRTVEPGEDFASEFTLVRLADGTCGTVKHETDYFDICEGHTVEH